MNNQKAPLLSICIPTYNRAVLLERMLATLDLALTRNPELDYEVVFRDNASTDNTKAVINKFAEKHPTRYFVNEENIGVTRNILKCSDGAQGEYIWMLGDDDLVVPDAFEIIHKQLDAVSGLDGHIACHALAVKTQREEFEKQVLAEIFPSGLKPLVRSGTNLNRLERFEDFYQHTDIGTALNFLSNVIFRREKWEECKGKYEKHCEDREWFTDSITSSGYMWVWADFLVGKPVGLIEKPLVIGFVGQQLILSKWPVLSMVFFLEVSQHYLRLGADPDCVRLYQRRIYGASGSIRQLTFSHDEYAQKHFSLKKLIQGYGDDPYLWQSLTRSILGAQGRRDKLKMWMKVTQASIRNPRYAGEALKLQARMLRTLIRRGLGKIKGSFSTDYETLTRRLNQKAKAYFSKSVRCKSVVRLEHPVYLKNPKCMEIGEGFSAGPGLRLECWDRYRDKSYAPTLQIGDRVSFNNNCHVGVINEVRIGNDVLIGSNVLITDHQHGNLTNLDPQKPFKMQPLHSKGPVVIEDDVWIGENVCIMPGVIIGTRSVIGANAVVTKNVPEHTIVAGNPAKTIRVLA